MDKYTKIENLKAQINHVPTTAGCYLWKDSEGRVIYVGKAKNLRSRMRQYVNFQDDRLKIPLLVDDIESFEYVVVGNENESLILEKNLINQYKPYYNADFKDDKSYPFIAITKGDFFPAIKFTREKHNPKTRYFGPYTDSRAARQTVDIVRKIVPICTCSCATWRRLNKNINREISKNEFLDIAQICSEKPCFDCHVGLGPGACCNRISQEDYLKNVAKVEKFLNGQQNDFIREIDDEMQYAAQSLDFERAGRLKQRLDILSSLSNKQNIVSQSNLDADVVGFYREETIAGAHVLIVREGRIINSNEFVLNRGLDIENNELVHMFLLRYYDDTTSIPRTVVLDELPDDQVEIEAWLTEKLNNSYGAKVRLESPKKGNKAKLVKMAQNNAKHSLRRYKFRTNYDDKRINDALLQLESALAMNKSPMRIECFDISTIHGSYTVASMVVFTGGRPDKNQYRRFKIKTPLDEANDFLSMQEVLRRRYCKKRLEDKRFGETPDLILLDGGKPQLTAALKIFEELNIDLEEYGIALAGLAKRDEELFVPWALDSKVSLAPIVLPDGSSSLYLVKQVRDEAHRFAITFHRQLRAKGMTASILDEIPGMGIVRKKALLKYFGSFKKLKAASLQEIIDSRTIPLDVAKETFRMIHLSDVEN